MTILDNKNTLNRQIKEAIQDEDAEFPLVLRFCEGLGHSTFEITIKKMDSNMFIDKNGQKWVKAK